MQCLVPTQNLAISGFQIFPIPIIGYFIHLVEGTEYILRLEAMWLVSYLLKGRTVSYTSCTLPPCHGPPLHQPSYPLSLNLAPSLVYYVHQLPVRDLK